MKKDFTYHTMGSTLRNAISAVLHRIGTWLARLQPCLDVPLEWVERIPQLFFIARTAPSISGTLPCGVLMEKVRNRQFALFRQGRRVMGSKIERPPLG